VKSKILKCFAAGCANRGFYCSSTGSSFLSSNRILAVAINYRVIQNKPTPDFSFKFVLQQLFENRSK